jgi:hypothetical protein
VRTPDGFSGRLNEQTMRHRSTPVAVSGACVRRVTMSVPGGVGDGACTLFMRLGCIAGTSPAPKLAHERAIAPIHDSESDRSDRTQRGHRTCSRPDRDRARRELRAPWPTVAWPGLSERPAGEKEQEAKKR